MFPPVPGVEYLLYESTPVIHRNPDLTLKMADNRTDDLEDLDLSKPLDRLKFMFRFMTDRAPVVCLPHPSNPLTAKKPPSQFPHPKLTS